MQPPSGWRLGSNRQISIMWPFAENRAKLTPPPSQVAPSGWGRPGSTRNRPMLRKGSLPGVLEDDRRERRKRQRERGRTSLPGRGFRMHRSGIAGIRAAVDTGVRVEPFDPAARPRHAYPVALTDHRSEVADHEDRRVVGRTVPHIGIGTVVGIGRFDPLEARGLDVLHVQSGRLAIEAIEVPHQALHSGMKRIAEEMPVERMVVVPFVILRELAANETKLL